MNFSEQFLAEVQEVTGKLDASAIERVASILADVRGGPSAQGGGIIVG